MEKYLINILKDKDFDEIVIGDACIYKEGEYFIVSASYSEYKLSKKLYRYLKLNGLNTKVRIADNKTPNKKKIDKLYQGIPKKDISFLFYAADGIFSIYDYEGLTEVQNLVNHYKSFIGKDMSALERLLMAYDIVKSIVYDFEDVDKVYGGNIKYYMDTGYIACAGFSTLLSMILDKNSKDLIVRCEGIYGCTEKDDGHARSVVIIDDNKYNFKGLFVMDATFDSNLVDNNILIKREDNYNYFLLNVKQVNREYYNFLDSEFFSKVKSYMKLNSKKNKYNLTSAFEDVFDVRLNRNEMVELTKNFRNQETILKALVRVRKQEGYSEFETIRSLHRYLRENIPNTKKIFARKVRDIVKENY